MADLGLNENQTQLFQNTTAPQTVVTPEENTAPPEPKPLEITVTYPRTPKPEPIGESTWGDYFDILSPFSIQVKNEGTRTQLQDLKRDGIDLSDPAFKQLYMDADVETRKAMMSARNNEDARRIYDRRQIFMAAQERISQDGLLTQIGMGAIPALASPTTLIPFGGVYKAAQLAQKARKLKMVATAAGTATAANLLDESMLDKQGMPTNYMGVAATSMILGGGLGLLSSMLISPRAGQVADNMLETGNAYSKEYINDNFVTIDRGTETLIIPKVEKTLYDKIPYLGDWLKSDITKMYQSESPLVRGIAARISTPTVSLKDANGDFVILGKTGADVKQEVIGNFNSKVNVPVSEAYAKWLEEGNVGTRADFNSEVHRLRTEESVRMANESRAYADEKAAPEIEKINAAAKIAKAEANAPATYYRDSKGKEQPATEEVLQKYDEDWALYKQQVEELRVIKEEKIPQMDAQAKIDIELAKELLKAQGIKGKDLTARMKDIRANINAQLKADKAALRSSVKPKRPREIEFYDKKLSDTKAGRKILAEKEAEIKKARDEARDAARAKHDDDFYANNTPNFRTNSPALKEAIEAYSKYYDDMLTKAQNLGIKELMGSKAGRIFTPRNWNFKALSTMSPAEAKSYLKSAIEGDTRNVYKSLDDLNKDIDDLYDILVSKDAQSKLGQGKGYYTKDLPFSKRLSERKLYLDESKLGRLVHTNMEDISGMYNYFMSGRMAVHHAFGDMIDKNGDLELSTILNKLQDEAKAKGTTVDAKTQTIITNTINDLLGVRRLAQYGDDAAWELSRNLMTYNSARLMGGAGGNQMIEMATIAMMHLARGIINKRFLSSVKQVADMLYREKGPNNDLGHVLLNSGYLETSLHAHRANRIADTESGFNPSMIERGLNSLADFQMKYNGQRYLTALAEDLSGGAIIQYIKRASTRDEALFSRWGLSMKDVEGLKKVLEKDDKNFLENMTQAQRDKFQLAINRGVSEWVVQPNSIHLPDWFKGAGPVKKLFFQFMKFPMIAQETLLRRGWTEDRAAMVAGIFGAVAMYTTLKYLREEASMAMGFTDKYERKYDIFNNEDDLYRTVLESTNYVANLGMFTTLWNYGNAFMQRPELGRDWANRNAIEAVGGPTIGLFQDLSDIASRLVNDGDFTSERQLNSAKQLFPLLALPGLSEGAKYVAKEYGD